MVNEDKRKRVGFSNNQYTRGNKQDGAMRKIAQEVKEEVDQ